MTCIVGIEVPGGVWLGADSFVGSGSYADVCTKSKLFRRAGWYAGVAGSSRVATVLEHIFEWPTAPAVVDDAAVARLAHDIGKALAADDYSATVENGGKSISMEVLVAAGGRLYSIGSACGVHRSRHGYIAAGSGENYALGAVMASKGRPPRERVLAGLRAAARHTPTVCGPFRLVFVRG